MYAKRLNRLQTQLQASKVDCLALVPGANMTYMTGIDFHLMERPTVAFIPVLGLPVFVLPSFEVTKLEENHPFDFGSYTYTDAKGPKKAFKQAINALPVLRRLAVEHLSMRVLELRLIQRYAESVKMKNADPFMSTLRRVKDAAEVEAMRTAVQIAEDVLQNVIADLRPGVTERQVASRLKMGLIETGGGKEPFEPIVLSGSRTALPHGVPSDAEVKAGQPLLIDYGTRSEGYISDITRTFFVGGSAAGKFHEIYEVVKEANAAGRAAAKPGVTPQEVDRAARQVIENAGYGDYFTHRTGHGVGLDAHEDPYIVEGNLTGLEVGNAFTIEPGIYLPGEFGVRIEDDMVITPAGAESLTTFDRELITIDFKE
ncbi:MAG: aminopeptidase P family protein [Anaerolineae bacterium]|nr:aminopeptidase P family protein [Anaerolineae bacterium]